MGFIVGLLTVFMVLDCVVLTLLVLIQLPKKEAGAGLAFGGAASDALFGAGSGNVLTKITKYTAAIFILLAIFISAAQSHLNNSTSTGFTGSLLSGQPPSPGPSPSSGALPTEPTPVPGTSPGTPAATVTNQAAPQPESPAPAPAATNK